MPLYCEVALPVPLDRTFTYAAPDGQYPQRGSRVIAPLRNEKLIGVVMSVSNTAPADFEARYLEAVLDQTADQSLESSAEAEPLLSEALLSLAEWIAQYYLAPIGEVLRGMLPLMAEVSRTVYYRITDLGRDILANSLENQSGIPFANKTANPRKPAKNDNTGEEQNTPRRILERLASGDPVKVSTLRTASGASLSDLAALVRKKWIARETAAAERDARRTERFAVLIPEARLPALSTNQQAILAELAACGGEIPILELRKRGLSNATLQTLVRRGLVRIDERAAAFRLGGIERSSPPIRLNESQTEALASIASALGAFHPFLLHGVTGSGKTAVYLAAMQRALDRNLASILLVPEIGLTPQTAGLLDAAFGSKVALLHSALTPEERSEQWRRIRNGDAPIVVGTRSAIFAPVPHLGLILVDEEHDQSYKQEETPRYNARDVAVMRAKFANAVVVLGSATPSLETWHNSEQSKYKRIEMRERVNQRPLPEVELVDMRGEFQQTGQENLFSRSLIQQTQAALERGEQAIILLNRRGYSFAVMCRACGAKLECQNCAIALTHHKPPAEGELAREGQRLECHYCGYRRTVPARCPQCDSEHLYYLGAGSQQGEERLTEIFPTARIGRMDRDTVRGRHDLERLLSRLHSGEINLLVGTQMIAKGHDIHGVTLVGVVGCDHALSMPDFRAAERVFQLMTQVSGRAGRGELPGRVVVQTYHPDHYAILAAAKHDYAAFIEKELKYRRWMHYPPFGVLANVLIQSPKLEEAANWSAILGKWFQQTAPQGVRVLGPCTAPVARIKGIYRFHLILKSVSRQTLNGVLRSMLAHADTANIPRRNITVDVDAQRLM
ncbi:replication restart helicase PriA [Occallatibacter riparius]|uniref:Replication restart protein PriA n=1 Tax=Occallatibacter riparius TaxID=1002689 RepID=A0A9J7BP67_9BACT|nr:primosomal protein N' [Occallatibacter riparius]UWZ82718.1 primosomal protein N' [Occallatibacter riparius]